MTTTGSEPQFHGAPDDPQWRVAVFAHREGVAMIGRTLAAVGDASEGNAITVDVLVNGRLDLAEEIAASFDSLSLSCHRSMKLQIWSFDLADKAHAWNHYVHQLWSSARTTFFLDGYVCVRRDALNRLDRRLSDRPEALCASGAPANGWSTAAFRRAVRVNGGIHGNLYAIPMHAMQTIRSCGFRLPLGIYRTDSTMGAAMAYAFDPSVHDWDLKRRVSFEEAVSWRVQAESIGLRSWWANRRSRRERQLRGDVENRAVRSWFTIRRLSAGDMPTTVGDLIDDWRRHDPDDFAAFVSDDPALGRSVSHLGRARDWSIASRPPTLVASR